MHDYGFPILTLLIRLYKNKQYYIQNKGENLTEQSIHALSKFFLSKVFIENKIETLTAKLFVSTTMKSKKL